MNKTGPILIYLHVPKSGGTTLTSILRRQYRSACWQFGNREVDEFNLSPPLSWDHIKAIAAHLSFGVHKQIPRPSNYFTVLRDPVDRMISLYYYIRRTPEHYLHTYIMSNRMTLRDYAVSDVSRALDNGQTRMFCGLPEADPFHMRSDEGFIPNGALTSEILALARQNLLESCLVIGTTDRFDETLILLKRKLGWRWPFYIKRNVSLDRLLIEDIHDDVRALIEDRHIYDRALYQEAAQWLERTLRQQGRSFWLELWVFQRLNAIYGVIARLLNLRHKLKTKLGDLWLTAFPKTAQSQK